MVCMRIESDEANEIDISRIIIIIQTYKSIFI